MTAGGETRSGLSLLPSVDAVLADPRIRSHPSEPRSLLRSRIRATLDSLRSEIRAGLWAPAGRAEALERTIREASAGALLPLDLRLERVWNATGVLLHTNLGRAVLPAEARRALVGAASGYSSLETDLESGERISRLSALRELIPLLTGAEAGFAVNNCAGALFLAMAALAHGREVLVSRGQLVEIGGSFRLPEILEAAGARLREVGTTNRTRIADYRRARTDATALVLRAHRSNFRLVGFCEEPTLEELSTFCREAGLPFVDDLGSGALRAYRDLFPGEPCIEDSIAAGVDLICVSADKLLGLGQGGILAGRREIVERLQKHPIARVVRLDKTLLAVIEAGLRIHLAGPEEACRRIPLLRALRRDPSALERAAERCAAALRQRLPAAYRIDSMEVEGEVGGGSLPASGLRSIALALRKEGTGADSLAARLRAGHPPVVGRIQEGAVLLDLRGIEEEEEADFLEAVAAALVEGGEDE